MSKICLSVFLSFFSFLFRFCCDCGVDLNEIGRKNSFEMMVGERRGKRGGGGSFKVE